jgi:CHASE2 domain-containing sensor protein
MAKFHKHIARHTRRYLGHFTKYLYERDTILSTVGVFVFLILLGMIPINFYVLNPMKMALKDFDFNDISYAKLGKGKKIPDPRIVIVNIGHLDRGSLGELIEKVSSMKPKVIGLDAYFETEREPDQDSLLRSVFMKTKNLVAASRQAYNKEHDKNFFIEDYFDSAYHLRGFVNVDADTIGTVRIYSPFSEVDNKRSLHFSSAIVHEYKKDAYEKLKKRKKKQEIINYSRRTYDYMPYESDQIMQDKIAPEHIKDKIVLLGYINQNPDDIEDKKFTPMNAEFVGKVKPDMNGVIVHANIISMVLDGNFIKKMPKWVAWIVAILIGWLHMSLFIRYYLENHIWFHLVAKLAQVFSAIFFVYLGIWIFDKFAIKLDMKYTLYVIVLAVDIIYFYEAFAVWLNKKFKFRTVFGHHHHPIETAEHHEQSRPQSHH